MAELPLAQGIDRFKQNEDRMDRFTNGSDTQTFVTSGGQIVPSIRKFLKDKDSEINVATDGILDQSEAARDAAISARDDSEEARDEAVTARNQSQAWAEGTEPGGPTTRSSKGWADRAAEIAASIRQTAPNLTFASGLVLENADSIIVERFSNTSKLAMAIYSKVTQPANAEPTHTGKFQSADGFWFEINEESPSILMFGAMPGSASYAAANVVAINAAIAYKSLKGGGKVLGAVGTFHINAPLNFAGITGVEFDGLKKCTILKLVTPFTGGEIVSLKGTRNVIFETVIDCSAITTAGLWLSGVRVENGNTVDCGVRSCHIKDASFCGIWMNDSNGTYTHVRFFAEHNIVTNVGWMGISFCGTINGRLVDNDVSRTGFTAVWAENRNIGLRIVENDVTKATPPYRIYDGPGSVGGVEKGFLIGYAPSNKDTLIADNRCIDNRNATEDGIGLGEDGTEHGPAIIRNNFVQYAGLFGIDVASRATVHNNRIEEPAQSGIFMSLDLGGSIAQSIVKDNTIRSCNGPYAIQISQNMGNPLTIADCEISGNIIVDYRATPQTQYGIRIRRNDLTITNLKIANNIAINIGTAGAGFLNDGTGQDWPIFMSGNKWRNQSKAVSGNFSTTGYEEFTLSNASATDFTLMTGGYEGKEITIYFNDGNTTLKPDWLNNLSGGSNRIIGLGNVARLMAAGDVAKLRYRSGLGWQITAIVDSY